MKNPRECSTLLRQIFVLWAGTSAVGCYTGLTDAPRLHVSFDLPAGWVLVDDEPDYKSARLDRPSKDGSVPYVKLELIKSGIIAGGNESAGERIRDHFDARSTGEAVAGWPNAEFTTLTLASGLELHASISPDNYWLSHGDAKTLAWGSVFAFSRDGYVVQFYLSDRVDLYQDDMDAIARSTVISRY